MSEESLENKKSYIKKEIEDKGFNVKDFENYLSKEKSQTSLDLEKIQFMEIQAYVVQYQANNQNKKSQTTSTNQNQQKNVPKKAKKNSSDDGDEEEPEDLWGDFDDLKVSNDNYYDDKSSIINKELTLQEYKEKEKLSSVEKEDKDYNSPFDQKFFNIIGKKLESISCK